MLRKFLMLGLAAYVGYFFYLYNPLSSGLYTQGYFSYAGDCEAMRVFAAGLQSTPVPGSTPTPGPAFTVSPKCYLGSAQGD